ncbi:TPM domain-containing protein [Lactobacillus johnsonii]|uniref:TPM domain-containing protein n=1 Tax=Lactobacillus johnsonii TaxID=33959 RepID=A0A9X0J7U9_LACJH|nr:TPM domain-containing protein [Lactobacillus johnsonii]KXN76492.1 hypothetical protein AYJ53_02990 [Lactobacillus johnsonii]
MMSIKQKFSLIFLTIFAPLLCLMIFNKPCFADDEDSFLQFDEQDSLFPSDPSYVLDQASIINDSTQDYVNDINNNILDKLKGKPVIAVITSKDCQGEDIADYSQKMFDKYHFGKGKLDNGVLIVINKEDYQVRVQTGYGMESILPDIYLNKLIVKAFTKQTKSRTITKGNGQSGGGGASATVNVAGEELVHHKTYSQGTEELVKLITQGIKDKVPMDSKANTKNTTSDDLFATMAELMQSTMELTAGLLLGAIPFIFLLRIMLAFIKGNK